MTARRAFFSRTTGNHLSLCNAGSRSVLLGAELQVYQRCACRLQVYQRCACRVTVLSTICLSIYRFINAVLADLQVYQRCIAECENRVEPELVRPCVRRCIAVVFVKTDCPVQPMQSLFYLGSGCVGVSTREMQLHCKLKNTA